MSDEEFYRKSLVRVAKASGIEEPIQLIALAENNEQNYVDLLVLHIERLRERAESKPKRCYHNLCKNGVCVECGQRV